MTDFGRRAGVGDMLKADYDPILAAIAVALAAHNTQHEDTGTDEIDCSGLTGTGGAGILGDGTVGRVFRSSHIYFKDGTEVAKLKMELVDNWNGDAIAEQDNIGKGETVGHFTWSADGTQLNVLPAGLSGNVLFAIGIVWKPTLGLETQSHLTIKARADANTINVRFYEQGSGDSLDIGVLIDLGYIYCTVIYITDA